jgi:putative membrane protein
MQLLTSLYPWLKAFHIVAVIAWMAGMLYLPRLFVYHAGAAVGSAQSETFKVMERKLLKLIINPGMIATLLLGLLLVGTPGLVDWGRGYMWLKLALVLGLAAYHGFCARWVKAFAADRNTHSERFYRRVNEIPAVLMLLIVILIVVRPF